MPLKGSKLERTLATFFSPKPFTALSIHSPFQNTVNPPFLPVDKQNRVILYRSLLWRILSGFSSLCPWDVPNSRSRSDKKQKLSSCLSDQFRLGFTPRPGSRRELLNLGNLGRWQTRKQIFQVIERVDTMPPATAQQCVNHGAAFASFRMSEEQKVLFSECRRTNRVFYAE